jgi:predicted ester cyclase
MRMDPGTDVDTMVGRSFITTSADSGGAPMRRLVIVTWFIAGTMSVFGCSRGGIEISVEERNMAIVRAAHASLAGGDVEAFKSFVAPDYVRHCQAMPPGLQELRGTEEFFGFIEGWLAAVPEYTDEISQMIAQGDKVAYVSTMTGVQTGSLGELPATGREFTIVNIIIQRLENGKVAETWVSWDNVALLSQLGHFPAE